MDHTLKYYGEFYSCPHTDKIYSRSSKNGSERFCFGCGCRLKKLPQLHAKIGTHPAAMVSIKPSKIDPGKGCEVHFKENGKWERGFIDKIDKELYFIERM